MDITSAVQATRGPLCENRYAASVVVCTATGTIQRQFSGFMPQAVFLRSAAKPFQAMPLLAHPNAQMLSQKEWAIICASHAGNAEQIALVQSVLAKAKASVADLQCGPHAPFDEMMNKALLCSDTRPTAVHNNCSGKHAGMLLACHLYDWDKTTYLDPNHPLQQAILAHITAFSSVNASEVFIAIDGCGAPVFGLPMPHIAQLWANFVTLPQYDTLIDAMTTYPTLIGDTRRIDSQLMTVTQGNLVAKVGADGFIGIGHRLAKLGLAIKCLDGNNSIRDVLTVGILKELGWITAHQYDALRQQPAFSTQRLNTQQRVIGSYQLQYPWAETR